jgi:hypothetical protein
MNFFASLSLLLLLSSSLTAQEYANFVIRYAQGGFTDSRSELGKLGGGQLALDMQLKKYPFIVLSYSQEYYTNSASPTHSYEIASMSLFNLSYFYHIDEQFILFGGGGVGLLNVPDGSLKENSFRHGDAFDIELGSHWKFSDSWGAYGVYKHLYAQKTVSKIKVIDFNEEILLLGVSYHFMW